MRVLAHARWPGASGTAVNLGGLPSKIGSDDFYLELARLDPRNESRWKQMQKTQLGFAKAEPSYQNPAARTYSASCRETLHRLALELYRTSEGADIYPDFIELHPTLFKENGACHLPVKDQLGVLLHTEPMMLFGHGNPLYLAEGTVDDKRWIPMVQRASDQTRAARKKKGLPVTVSGYPKLSKI
ncbi:MAG: hypothetical protein U1E65_25435 [Myxococcota bacterium]